MQANIRAILIRLVILIDPFLEDEWMDEVRFHEIKIIVVNVVVMFIKEKNSEFPRHFPGYGP